MILQRILQRRWPLVFAFSFSAQAALVDKVAAIVGESPILLSDIENLRKQIKETPAMGAAYRIDKPDFTNKELLDRMIEDKIIQLTVKELDISVSDAEVESQITSIQKQNNISRAQLESSLKGEGVPMNVYKSNIKNQLERRALFDRELRRGGGVSESELRAVYEKTAEVELKLLLVRSKAKTAHTDLVKLVDDINKGNVKGADAEKTWGADNLGWINPKSLNPEFLKLLSNAQPGRAYGPIKSSGVEQVFIVEGNRKGSSEGFESAKQELMAKAQGEDFEKRFAYWIEQKKRSLHIVVNN